MRKIIAAFPRLKSFLLQNENASQTVVKFIIIPAAAIAYFASLNYSGENIFRQIIGKRNNKVA